MKPYIRTMKGKHHHIVETTWPKWALHQINTIPARLRRLHELVNLKNIAIGGGHY